MKKNGTKINVKVAETAPLTKFISHLLLTIAMDSIEVIMESKNSSTCGGKL